MNGPLLFGSIVQFLNLFDVKNDPGDIVMVFTISRVIDHSALESVNCVADSYREAGKRVYLRNLTMVTDHMN